MVVFVVVIITVYFCYFKIVFDPRHWSLWCDSLQRCPVEALWPKKRFFCNPSNSENLLLVFPFWRTNFTGSAYQSTSYLRKSWGAVKKFGTKVKFRVDYVWVISIIYLFWKIFFSLYKEFLWTIKGSLLTFLLYNQWLAVNQKINDKEKLAAVQR